MNMEIVPTGPIPESELPDAIRQLSPLQQSALRALAEHPALDRPAIARLAGCGESTLYGWLWGLETPFRRAWEATKGLSLGSLPSMAVAMARETSLSGMQRAIAYGDTLDPDDSAGRASVKLRAIEMRLKAAGVLADQSTGGTVNIAQLLLQVHQEAPPDGRQPWER